MKKKQIKTAGFEELQIALEKQVLITARLEELRRGKRTNLELKKSGHCNTMGPRGYSIATIQDVMEALNKVEDKSLPITYEGQTADGEHKDWGDIDEIFQIEVDKEAVENGDSYYAMDQIVMVVSSNV